jgi:multicomponent Na+:H+ antiporter subunit D
MSKWLMFQGAAVEGHWMAMAVLGTSTLLNAAYFLPILHAAFLREPRTDEPVHGEAPWPMVGAMVVTAAATIALPFVAGVPLGLARSVAGVSP